MNSVILTSVTDTTTGFVLGGPEVGERAGYSFPDANHHTREGGPKYKMGCTFQARKG